MLKPPGKKLATLSLLSGGEQALTALSLIFAVFRCNPAPVCVLDEVDAPLDDANIDRFCALLDDMVRETGTRFLVVTHHHLTMARMDRLYGVTMQERGVSRVLSWTLRGPARWWNRWRSRRSSGPATAGGGQRCGWHHRRSACAPQFWPDWPSCRSQHRLGFRTPPT